MYKPFNVLLILYFVQKVINVQGILVCNILLADRISKNNLSTSSRLNNLLAYNPTE